MFDWAADGPATADDGRRRMRQELHAHRKPPHAAGQCNIIRQPALRHNPARNDVWRSRRDVRSALCAYLSPAGDRAHLAARRSIPAVIRGTTTPTRELNEWILAWVAHQLPRDPLHLFEANIFYPAHDALAFSEPLIVPALMGAPLAWAGASPVLVYNLVVIAGFALTAFATCSCSIDAWTGSFAGRPAAPGRSFAFNTHTLTRFAHVQGIHLYGLPLALLAIDRLDPPAPVASRGLRVAGGRVCWPARRADAPPAISWCSPRS